MKPQVWGDCTPGEYSWKFRWGVCGMPYFRPKYVIFATLFNTWTTVLKETNDKKMFMFNGAAHSLYLVIELNSNKQIKIIISKFTFVCFFHWNAIIFVWLLSLKWQKWQKWNKKCKSATVTLLVRCAISDTGSRECSTAPYFRPILVKSIATVRPKGLINFGAAYSHLV